MSKHMSGDPHDWTEAKCLNPNGFCPEDYLTYGQHFCPFCEPSSYAWHDAKHRSDRK